MTRRLKAKLEGTPPLVIITQEDLPKSVWYEISLVVFHGNSASETVLTISPVSLLQNRVRLIGIILEFNIEFAPNQGIIDLLKKASDDNSAFIEAVDSDRKPARLDLSLELMDGGHTLLRTLRDFQEDDLARLASLAHGANFSVPGAGKTTVSYVLHAMQKASGRVNKLLVVAPLSAFGAWEEDAVAVLSPAPSVTRFRQSTVPNADVVLVNYQRLPHVLPTLAAWMARHDVHLVIDEAHRAKRGASGEWGRALLELAPLAARRDILTGTPAPNHPKDLVALLNILWPSGRASSLIPRAALAKEPNTASMVKVNSAISPFYVRTSKAKLGLPPVTFVPLALKMPSLQQQIYDAMQSRYAGLLNLSRRDQAMFAQMGEVAMYLLQAASSPRLLRTSADPARAYRYPPLAIPAGSRLAEMVETYADREVPAKIAATCRIVHANAAAGRKTLVWSNFPDNLLDLEQQLAALQPAVVYGAIPSIEDAEPGVRTRERELARFRADDDECMVLLANPAALAEGVSLHHDCHDAVYVDRTFNAGQYLQSVDRIHRLGLPSTTITTITLLTSSGSIDERVNRRVRDKATRLSQMLDDEDLVQMALPDEDDPMGVLDDSLDLAEVLAHLAEAPSSEDIA